MPLTTTANISGFGMSVGLPDGMTSNQGASIVDVTTSPLALTRTTYMGRTITINKATGVAVTLSAATGSGDVYEFVVGTAMSGGSTTFTCAGSDKFQGNAWVISDGAAAVLGYAAVAGTSTVATLNGTTQGGLAGHRIRFTDIKAARWQVESFGAATGSEATIFS